MRVESFRSAAWLDEDRVTAYALIFVALYTLSAAIWIILSPNLIDPFGKPLGTDFMTVWSGGRLALEGEPAAAYDYARHFGLQRRALPWPDPAAAPYYAWHYPPFFMFIAAGLALLPYGAALALWTAGTLPLYLAAVRSIVPHRKWLLLALAFPAVFVNLGHGQSGFFTAGLLGFGLIVLDKQPILAGVLFGLLAYKPQLGLLLPLALAADRRWHAFLSAAVTVAALCAAAYIVLGPDVWRAFFVSVPVTRTFILEQGAMGWEKMQSIFSALRLWGVGLAASYEIHAAVSLWVTAAVVWVWMRPVTMALKGAALVTGCLLVTPYVFDYDFVLLALPIAWLAASGLRTGFLRWEKVGLLAAFVLPLVARSFAALGGPIAPPVLLLLLVLIMRRTRAEMRIARMFRSRRQPLEPHEAHYGGTEDHDE